ncbi:MAG: metallophosphoesterase [Clostridia bacterium]|nr:metallophosphoesterase [Clostridia bacterium]
MMNNTQKTLPEFVRAAAEDAIAKVNDFTDGKPLFTLAMITDVHTGGNDRYHQLAYLDGVYERYPFDLMVNLGDIGLDFSGDRTLETDEVRKDILAHTREGMNPVHPWLYAKGNHDRVLPRAELTAVLNKNSSPALNGVVFGTPLCDYGYVDFPAKKFRFIVLDTSDNDEGIHFTFSKEQLAWLIGVLTEIPAGYRVILGSHVCLDKAIGKWRSYPDDGEGTCFSAVRSMLHDFANHLSGEDRETGLSWDFRDSGAKLLCALAGDSHFNADINRDGVRVIIRQGYGGVSDSEMPEWATKDPFDYHTCVNFDILAVREDGAAKLFRVGAGAGERDLTV